MKADLEAEEIKIWIQKAESIKTSGRWSAANGQIRRLAAEPEYRARQFDGNTNDFLFEVFSSLCAQVCEEYLNLKKTYETKSGMALSEIAWRGRNLLELFVWASYCSKSTDNARRFYEDAGRDLIGIADSFLKWGIATGQDPEWIKGHLDGKELTRQQMAQRGMKDFDAKYTEISKAAKAIGLKDSFLMDNRLLSKFAHPTALLVMRPIQFEQALRDPLFSKGCMYFCGAFEIIEIWLRDLEVI